MVKRNIFLKINREAVTSFGMFHQIRVDGGREFFLMLGMQEIYREKRSRQDIDPYRQTQSKQVRLHLDYLCDHAPERFCRFLHLPVNTT